MAKKYSQEFKQKLADRYVSGDSSTKLRKEFGISVQTMLGWFKKLGVRVRDGHDRYSTPEFRKKVVDLYIQGETAKSLQQRFHVASATLINWVREAGSPTRDHPYTRRTTDFKKKVVDLYLSGIPSPQLGKQFGVADKSIRNWVHKAGEQVRAVQPTTLSSDGLNKTCSLCGSMKPLEKFAINPNGTGGRHAACKSCHKKRMRKTKYGISSEDFDNILNIQGGVCAICGEKAKESKHTGWYIDHDHACCPGEYTCGKCVRGILCPTCNHGLGHFKDSEGLLSKAILYLQKYRETGATVGTILGVS